MSTAQDVPPGVHVGVADGVPVGVGVGLAHPPEVTLISTDVSRVTAVVPAYCYRCARPHGSQQGMTAAGSETARWSNCR